MKRGHGLLLVALVAIAGCSRSSSLAERLGANANNAFQQAAGPEFCGPAVLAGSAPAGGTFLIRPGALPNPAVPKPKAVNLVPDDHRVRVVINEGQGYLCGTYGCEANFPWSSNSFGERLLGPERVAGFYLRWKEQSATDFTNSKVFTFEEFDIQPLDNAKTYDLEVYTVDMDGSFSEPVKLVMRPDPSRVERLRKQMTAFFDDFNLGAGSFDELKWNTAFGINTCLDYNGSFINTQFHAHSAVSSCTNDRAPIMSRPRAILDMTGGQERRIVFDMDGVGSGRDEWYLDVFDARLNAGGVDLQGRDTVDADANPRFPGSYFRITFKGDSTLLLQFFNPNGSIGTTLTLQNSKGFRRLPNLQRHWEVRMSPARQRVFIDGKLVGESTYALPFEKAQLHFLTFSYNTAKAGDTVTSFLHWDNFGFDGPAPQMAVHNYKVSDNGNDRLYPGSGQGTATLNIPDSLAGAVSRRLRFTLQRPGTQGLGNSNPCTSFTDTAQVVVNAGTPNAVAVKIPNPVAVAKAQTGVDYALAQLVGATIPFSMVLDLPDGALKVGANTLEVQNLGCGVNNLHAEFEFPVASAPSYTQPYVAAGGGNLLWGMPTLWSWGPRVNYTALGPFTDPTNPFTGLREDLISGDIYSIGYQSGAAGQQPLVPVVEVQSPLTFAVSVDTAATTNASGGFLGIRKIDVLIDGQLVETKDLWGKDQVPPPRTNQKYSIDVSRFAGDGLEHQLQVLATSHTVSDGGKPDSFRGFDGNGGNHGGLMWTESGNEPNPPVRFKVKP